MLAIVLAVVAQTTSVPAPITMQNSQSEEIVVVGARNSAQARRDFVKSLTRPSFNKQLGRFYDPVCPYVAGLPDEYNRLVVDRMRKVALAVGMKVDKEKCRPNALLYVVKDKAKLMEQWRKSDSVLFGDDMSDTQIRLLVHNTEPATSWQLIDYRGSNGRVLAKARIARFSGVSGENIGKLDSAPATAYDSPWAPVSRIIAPLQIGFGASVLVVDGTVAGGSSLRQLADFAAMQLYAHTSLQKGVTQAAPTILTLLDDASTGRPAPRSLTEWDLAYLKALYSYEDMYLAGLHQGELAKRMERYLAEAKSQ